MTPNDVRDLVPEKLWTRSGKIFYSGRAAFCGSPELYVLGLNPGGDPVTQADETVMRHSEWVLREAPEDWSAYRDELWRGKSRGTHGIQPRLLHLFERIGRSPGAIAASNLIFVRSRSASTLGEDACKLADHCWRFHDAVLQRLQPKVILCLGKKAGNYVRLMLGADEPEAEFVEQNARQWKSVRFRSQTRYSGCRGNAP